MEGTSSKLQCPAIGPDIIHQEHTSASKTHKIDLKHLFMTIHIAIAPSLL
jgi:hypothetical protein